MRIVESVCRVTFLVTLIACELSGFRAMGNDVVKVMVSYSAPNQHPPLADLTAVVGGDKYSWESLRAGADRRINLLPGPQDDRQLLFSYTFKGERRHWKGPEFGPGTGYQIEVKVDAAGRVSERHCVLPCQLAP